MVGITENRRSTEATLRAIRRLAQNPAADAQTLRYTSLPDERYDLSLAAYRVYGERSLFWVIAAAAGLDSVEQALPEQEFVLPTLAQLQAWQSVAQGEKA